MNHWLTHCTYLNPYTRFSILTITPHCHDLVSFTLLMDSVKNIFRHYSHVIAVNWIYETSDKGKLHIHGLVAHQDIRCKWLKLCKHPIYKYQLDPYCVAGGWINYIVKDRPTHSYLLRKKLLPRSAGEYYKYSKTLEKAVKFPMDYTLNLF